MLNKIELMVSDRPFTNSPLWDNWSQQAAWRSTVQGFKARDDEWDRWPCKVRYAAHSATLGIGEVSSSQIQDPEDSQTRKVWLRQMEVVPSRVRHVGKSWHDS